MYAPLGIAAWTAKTSCCVNGICAVPQHHHSGASSASQHDTAHCEHGAAGMSNCNMACCHEQQTASTSPVAYLLPAPVAVSASMVTVQVISRGRASTAFRFVEPLSPPPRS